MHDVLGYPLLQAHAQHIRSIRQLTFQYGPTNAHKVREFKSDIYVLLVLTLSAHSS